MTARDDLIRRSKVLSERIRQRTVYSELYSRAGRISFSTPVKSVPLASAAAFLLAVAAGGGTA